MKRIRYECDSCGAVSFEVFLVRETPPGRIHCIECGLVDAMTARPITSNRNDMNGYLRGVQGKDIVTLRGVDWPATVCVACDGSGTTAIAPDFLGDKPEDMRIGTASICPRCKGTGEEPGGE